MLGHPLDTRIRRIFAVTVDEGLSLTLDDTPTAYFPAHLSAPSAGNSSSEGSPRSTLSPHTLSWQGTPQLGACDRIEVPDDETYELLAKPEPVTAGRRTVGYSALVLPVGSLYPRSAAVKAQGNSDSLATIECAVFSKRSEQRGRGEYEGTFAEAPAAAWNSDVLRRNHLLHFADGSEWAIVEASLGVEVPFVTMAIRRAA